MAESPPQHERKRFAGIIRPAREEDIVFLQPILETWIRDRNTKQLLPDEVKKILMAVHKSIEGQNDSIFVVAETTTGEVSLSNLYG